MIAIPKAEGARIARSKEDAADTCHRLHAEVWHRTHDEVSLTAVDTADILDLLKNR